MKTKRFSKECRTTAIFKCIVTLKNGAHRILRMSIDKVARMTAAIRELRMSPFMRQRYVDFFEDYDINAYDVEACRFINERTGQVLLSI